ncbi:MAG: aminotransferase class V-fold PLP-dependent enzyme [Clostridiales bacterium]|nr:aminotransferase class V-fold PLP-dependent enzyme [Clostridiales bacterium]
MDKTIYLDNAATTFPKPETVYKKMDETNRNGCVNAGRGGYHLARQATALIDDTKKRIIELVSLVDSSKVVFTPSVTIAMNQILQGIPWKTGDVLYVTPFEHNAVARTAALCSKKYGIEIVEIPLDINTLSIDIEMLKMMFIQKQPRCICINHVSNVLGTIQPYEEIATEAKRYNAITILDAAQSLGLIDIDLNRSNIDFLAFAGHKTLYGPFGVGGFIINSETELMEVIVGGTGSDSLKLDMPKQIPGRYESSSPNIVAIAGLNEALKWRKDVTDVLEKEQNLTKYLIAKLAEIPEVKVYLPENLENHVGIVSFNVQGYKSEDIGMILDMDFGIAVRTGYHCAPYIHKWIKDEEYAGTVRVSVSYFNTMRDIDEFIEAVNSILDDK